jgi:superfamily II DNA/RNA helicase
VHRIGRTGRAGHTGIAVTLVDWDDIPRWQLINKALGLDFENPPETYSTSPWVYSDLDVPETATGRLPRSQRTREGLDAETLEDLGETGKRNRTGGAGSSSHGGRGSHGPSDRERGGDGERPAGSRSGRPRRRTRSGGDETPAGSEGEQPADSASTGAEAGSGAPKRRRRRRGGANRGGSESAA